MDVPPPSDGRSRETYHRGRKRGQVALAVLALLAAVGYGLSRWRPTRLEVAGDSMAPTLAPGDRVLAAAARALRPGEVVVLEHPDRPGLEVVKRVTRVAGDPAPDGRVLGPDEIWVEGDNLESSTDSRHFGAVSRGRVRGRVLLVYWPPARRRVVGTAGVRA
jgi:nickel-type superoxide dismutase maturation protease